MARDACVATAAVRLMLHHPFWCELYYSMKVIETYAVKTLMTDGTRMWVNPDYFNPLGLEYKVSALAHETTHKMLHHCTRGLGFIAPWDNIAADIVVNTMLHKNGFKIHPTWVQPDMKYDGWTFEAVYHDITKHLQEPPKGGGGGQGNQPQPNGQQPGQQGGQSGTQTGQDGAGSPQKGKKDGKGKGQGDPADADDDGGSGFCDAPGVPQKYKGAWQDVKKFQGSQEEIEAFEEKVEQQVQQAIAAAKSMGHAPAGVEMAMEKVTKLAKEKWFDHLRRYFQSLRIAEYDWNKINRRMAMKHRLIAPTQYTERLGPVVIFDDASGSCYCAAQQADFAGHVNSILSEAQPSQTIVAYFDTIVHKHTEVDPGSIEFEPQPVGGGGTSFCDLFPWLEREGITPDVVIILTDMYGTFPTEEPPFPVIWASTSKGITGPFGETIYIGDE